MDSNFVNWRNQDKLSLAILLATVGHFKQHDRGGILIFCILCGSWWLRTTDKELMQIAILHDIIEDTLITFADLKLLGFSERVIDVWIVLTKDENLSYKEKHKQGSHKHWCL